MGKTKKTASEDRKVRVHTKVLQDITEINTFIAITRQQPLNAIKVNLEIEETIDKIEHNPFAFMECEEILTKSNMYRRALCSSWVIIYKVTEREIIILGVIHEARRASRIRNLRRLK